MKIGFEVFGGSQRNEYYKAANELHITQQCASDHIKRLEKSIMSCCLSGVPNSV